MARRGSTMLSVIGKTAVKMTEAAARARDRIAEKSATEEAAARRRAEFAIMASSTERWIWLTDEKEGYVHAKVLKEHADGGMDVEVGAARIVKTAKKAELGPWIVRMAELKNHVDGKCHVRMRPGGGTARVRLSRRASDCHVPPGHACGVGV